MEKIKATLGQMFIQFVLMLVALAGLAYIWMNLSNHLTHYPVRLSFFVGFIPHWPYAAW